MREGNCRVRGEAGQGAGFFPVLLWLAVLLLVELVIATEQEHEHD